MDNPQTLKSRNQKNKGGRPRSDEREKRKYSVKVYFDQGNYTKLLRRSKNRQCSLSSLVYELAVNGYVREAMSKEDATNLRSLSGMANNLNQLAHELTSTISPLLKRGSWNWQGGLTRFSSGWVTLRDIYLLVPLCALTLPSICTYLGIYLHILFYSNFYDSTD